MAGLFTAAAGELARYKLDLVVIKVQLDTTVCRHLFTATSLYMFRVSRTHHQEC